MNQRLNQASMVAPLITLVVGLGVVYLVPRALASGKTPPGIVFVAVTLLLMIIFSLSMLVAARISKALPGKVVAFFILYNLAIIAAKFGIAPYNAYQNNLQAAFDATNFQYNAPSTYVIVGCAIFVLYLVVLGAIYLYFKSVTAKHQVVEAAVALPSSDPTAAVGIPPTKKPAVRPVFLVLLLVPVVFLGGGSILALPLVLGFIGLSSFLPYLTIVVSFSLIVAILVALYFGVLTFAEASKQEITLQRAAIVSTTFAMGAVMLVVFQVLWLVFIATLITLWPFNTYTVSSK